MTKERRNPSREVGTIGRTMDAAIERGMKPERRKNKMAKAGNRPTNVWTKEDENAVLMGLKGAQGKDADWDKFFNSLVLKGAYTERQIRSKCSSLQTRMKVKHSISLSIPRKPPVLKQLNSDAELLALWKS